MRPNLFRFATSELSQDAFLCWLLSWADPTCAGIHPVLHSVGIDFLKSIYLKAREQAPTEFSKVEIKKQEGHIDILCIVNGDTAIVIEDKTATKQHGDQLARYRDQISKPGTEFSKRILVYLQTGDQSDYGPVKEAGYTVLQRRDLLAILEGENGKAASKDSDILADFSSHLHQIEEEVQSYKVLAPSKWPAKQWRGWIGFYTRHQEKLEKAAWGYVANPSGGFLGCWWCWQGNETCSQYLQLEQETFCFKIRVPDESKRRELRDSWYRKILAESSKHDLKINRPNRFGNGEFMTVAILAQEYRITNGQGLLDLDETVSLIRKAECLLKTCASTAEVVN